MAITLDFRLQTNGLSSALSELTLWAGESAERARKIRDAFFCGDELCPGIVSIEQGPASDTGDLILRVDLSHWGRELMRALTADSGAVEGAAPLLASVAPMADRIFDPSEIAKVFTVPASQGEPVVTRRFPDSEVASVFRVPGREQLPPSLHKCSPDSLDPEVVMDSSEKLGEKE